MSRTIQDNVLPPELLIRPTEVIEHGSPETTVFEPNAVGSLGNASIPSSDLWRAGLDPYRQMGGDPNTTALRGAQALVGKLIQNHRVNQAPMTHILEREGGSEVIYHEPNLDDQSINVAGVEVSNGVEGLEHLAANLHTRRYQESPVTIRQSREMVNRLAAGMIGPAKRSFMEVLQRLGASGLESISADPLPGTADEISISTESGLVASSDGAEAPLRRIMQLKAQQQHDNADRPVVKYHPGQSNYASVNGQWKLGGPMPLKNGRLSTWPVIGQQQRPRMFGYIPGGYTPEPKDPGWDPVQVYTVKPMLPPSPTPIQGGGVPTTPPLLPSGGPSAKGAPISIPYIPTALPTTVTTTKTTAGPMIVGGPKIPSGGGGGGAAPMEEYDPDKNYWFPVSQEFVDLAGITGNYSISDLSSRAKKLNPLGSGYTRIARGTSIKKWFMIGSTADQLYVYAKYPALEAIIERLIAEAEDQAEANLLGEGPPPPGTGSEDTCSAVSPDGTVIYIPCDQAPDYEASGYNIQVTAGGGPNWLMIGGIALGAAALIGIAVVATRK